MVDSRHLELTCGGGVMLHIAYVVGPPKCMLVRLGADFCKLQLNCMHVSDMWLLVRCGEACTVS